MTRNDKEKILAHFRRQFSGQKNFDLNTMKNNLKILNEAKLYWEFLLKKGFSAILLTNTDIIKTL